LGCHPVAVHIYTQKIYRTTQITTEQHKYKLMWKSAGRAPVFASFTLAFALQLRKKQGKTSVKVRKTSVTVQYTYYQNMHTLQNPHKHTHIIKSTYTHSHTLQRPHKHTHSLQNNEHTHNKTHINTDTH